MSPDQGERYVSQHAWSALQSRILSGQAHATCQSPVEAFQAGFGPHAQEIMEDISNYTDQTPVIQISEVVVD
jgi:uncharacterized protein (TIGR02118 family)